MIDKRQQQLNRYLEQIFDNTDFIISKINDDASFRRYFRIIYKQQSFIAMDAIPSLEPIDKFVEIAELFSKNNINSPKIYAKNIDDGFLLLQDFADITLLQHNKKFDINSYYLAIDELIKIQKLPKTNLKNYSNKILTNEMDLAIKWFNPNFDHSKIFNTLLINIKTHKTVMVHRDYHSRNIMVYNNKLGILDFQDAVIGSYAYDLASLLKDAYLQISSNNLTSLLAYYFQKSNLNNYQQFIKDFDFIATQRHIKILGIFSRLEKRDGKNQYKKNIPQVTKYLLEISQKYPELQTLEQLCKQ